MADGKKNKKRRFRRPAVIGRSIRISARGWRRQPSPNNPSTPENSFQAPPLPTGMAEMSENNHSLWPHPIFFVIVIGALVFIAIIAWLIAHSSE
ncbi:MAG TPA: hypothetical protein VEF04_12630 [Blastocatellia bacterium]|nr:hypothetical protein [Blastocatellia bacterium]